MPQVRIRVEREGEVMLNFIRHNSAGQAKVPKVYDVEENPRSTVMAAG